MHRLIKILKCCGRDRDIKTVSCFSLKVCAGVCSRCKNTASGFSLAVLGTRTKLGAGKLRLCNNVSCGTRPDHEGFSEESERARAAHLRTHVCVCVRAMVTPAAAEGGLALRFNSTCS